MRLTCHPFRLLTFVLVYLLSLPQPLYAAPPSASSASATRPCDNLPSSNYVATFDDIGNLQCRKEGSKTLQHQFDVLGRLVSIKDVTTGRPLYEFTYNYLGQRTKSVYHNPQGADIVTFYLDGIYEIRGQGATKSSTLYVASPASGILASVTQGKITDQTSSTQLTQAVGQPLRGSILAGPAEDTLYFWKDHLGSTNLVTRLNNGQPQEVTRYVYEPYGLLDKVNSLGADSVTHQFDGQIRDVATGLDYFNARYYDPTVGRFASPDLLTPGGGRLIDGLNKYVGLGNDPINYTDPTGHYRVAARFAGINPAETGFRILRLGWEIVKSSVLPGYGEIQDLDVLADPKSSMWDLRLASFSLANRSSFPSSLHCETISG